MSRWSQGGGDTRRLLDLNAPWESGRRTPTPDTTGVPEWVTSGYNDDPRGLAIAVAHYRAPKATDLDRAAIGRYRAAPRAPTFACTSCNRHAFPKPTTCFWCRRGAR